MSGEELLWASERGDLDEANRLLSNGADVNEDDDVCDIYYIIICCSIYLS
jgi:hypothetical protein